MQQRLSFHNLIGMGFLAFAMFLGAGNLIFPPMAGYLAGTNIAAATGGFLITGVGLPLLGIIAISRVGGGFNAITQELPSGMVIFIGSCIFLLIGPLYAVPRTAMVAYEIGITPFFSNFENESLWLVRLVFCMIFFFVAWLLCLQPGKLLETVGKIITPALIFLLVVLGLSPIFMPQGIPGEPMGQYSQTPFLSGFLEGYLTMDALAALMFGIVIMSNLKSHGISEPRLLVKYSIYTGIIATIGLCLVYISLFYLGATTREMIQDPSNGSDILNLYVAQLSGLPGTIFMSFVVILACLTTAIGCITATCEYFYELLQNKLKYSTIVTIISLSCVFLANMGLNQLIKLFVPALFILYPIAITLIIFGLIRQHIPNQKLTYRATLLVAFFFSLIDSSQILDTEIFNQWINSISLHGYHIKDLPGFNAHMSWLLPSTICAVCTIIAGLFMPNNKTNIAS